MPDADLDTMTREQLVAEVRRLRGGIRAHRDSSAHDLCWHHPKLWGLLPDRTDPVPVVPEWPQFLRGCIRYRQSLDEQAPHAPRTREEHQGCGFRSCRERRRDDERSKTVWVFARTVVYSPKNSQA
jgi:hypothetical protein